MKMVDATKEGAAPEQHFKDALRLAPASPDSYPGDLTARDLLAEAGGQAPASSAAQNPESHLARNFQLYREGRYAESIAASRAAINLRPNYAEAWNNIGAAHNKLGQYDEAADACEQALRYKPDFELARNNLQYAHEMAKSSGN